MHRLRSLPIFLVLLASCGAPAAVPSAAPTPTSAPPATLRITAFGDSLTAGLGVTEADTYPAQLEAALRAEGIDVEVVNAGVSGDTSAQALDRLDWTLKQTPNLAIVALGANDGLRGLPVPQLESNLTAIVRRFQASGAKVLLGGMQIPPNYGPQYAQDFAAVYPRVAEATGATLIPFFLEGVAAEKELNQADGIHPTAEGYRRIVRDVLLPKVREALDV